MGANCEFFIINVVQTCASYSCHMLYHSATGTINESEILDKYGFHSICSVGNAVKLSANMHSLPVET